jgi:two-component system sensor histidine kinase KdpD
MRARASRVFLRPEPAPAAVGVLVAALAVAAITALIFPLRHISPPASMGVAYMLAVLLVSTIWGLRLGLLTALASAAAFNFFHLPPMGRFTVADEHNAVALGIFFLAAVVAAWVADLARSRASEAQQRRQEADLSADLARILLSGASPQASLADAARRLAQALDLPAARISLEDAAAAEGERSFALAHDGRPIGALVVDADISVTMGRRLEQRVVPALEALLAAALERDRLQTEVVETRALRRSDELKTALLHSVSHDLRTPLTAIIAAGSALGDGELPREDRAELGDAVVEEATRLTSLVEKLLDLSLLQGHAAAPRRQWCSVEEILHELADQLDPDGTRIALSLAPDLPLVRADAAQLERAFANLLENAARYSGAQRVSVRGRRVGDRLMIRVVDRGPGIAHEELGRIFEAFYRAPGQTARHTGSGLGLAIVKGFVEANGGRVWAESLPGQGTSFVVALPIEHGAPTAAPQEAAPLP